MPYFRGRPACDCLVAWLPAFEAELIRRGVIRESIDVYQLIGGAAASGGTHATGGAFDIVQRDPVTVWVARQMGADATWARLTMSPPHTHGVLRGCPHNGPARYQITAVDAGYNGLGSGGRGGPDDGPRPLSGRTWQAGIAWAAEQADDLPYTRDELTALTRAAVAAEVGPDLEQLIRQNTRIRQRVNATAARLRTQHPGIATRLDAIARDQED